MITLDVKLCLHCTRYLPIGEFGYDASKASGHRSSCKDCEASRWRNRHPGSVARGRYRERIEPEPVAALPVPSCRCLNGPLVDYDEDGIPFCFRCGKPLSSSLNGGQGA